jgi:HME family heavy-metal exporter
MFAYLIRGSLAQQIFVLCGAALLIIGGIFELRRVPVDVLPEIDRATVTIITEGEGLAPEEVERRVTFPIETAMSGLKGVERVRSTTSSSLSLVTIDFALGTDIYRNRQLVTERLVQVREQLPASLRPEMAPISSVMGEILVIAMSSDTGDMMALRDCADWYIRPRLMAIPGVSQVLTMGGDVRQLRVTPDPRRLDFFNVTVDQVERALTAYNTNTGGSSIDQYGRRFLIMNVGRTEEPSELVEGARRLVVAYQDGRPVLLQQLAEVGFEPRIKQGDAGYMGQPAVLLRVQKQPGVSTLALTASIEKALVDMRPFLPKGIHADHLVLEQRKFIEKSISDLKRSLFEAVAVIAVVLFVFLLNVRTTVISLTAILISILTTVLVFALSGRTINTMTLGGLAIAIGELVDDAVVGVENTFRRLRLNRALAQPRPVLGVIADATVEARTGIFYATLIVLLVFFPLFSLPGVEGMMFTSLALAYLVAIFASLITAITLTPVMSYYLLPQMNQRDRGESALVRVLKRQNERLLASAFAHQPGMISAAVIGVVAATFAVADLPRAFLPPLNEGAYLVELNFQPGISLVESNRMGAAAEKLLLEVPEVQSVGRRTGRAELDLHANGVYQTEIDVDLKSSRRSLPAVLQDIRNRLGALPGSVFISEPLTQRIHAVVTGLPSQLAIKIFGDDLDTLLKLADDLRGRLAHVAGLTDLQVEAQARIPQLRVQIDPEAARIYGVTPAQLTRLLETLSAGRVVSEVVDENRRYNVVIRLEDGDRTSAALRSLLVDTPVGHVQLQQLADIRDTDGPNQIIRDNSLRRVAILANTDGSDMARINRGIEEQIGQMHIPAGYSVGIEGNYAAQQAAATRIAILSLISLTLIFALLYTRYHSAVLALIVMLNVPLALIGGIAALWIVGGSLSLATMIGFITLAAIGTRNGILKISHYIDLVLHQGEVFGGQMIVRGSLERMTPVLMTALSVGFAMVPLMLGGDQPGKELLSPVALVVFGGLIGSTLADAAITPMLFLRFGERPLDAILRRGEAELGSEAY